MVGINTIMYYGPQIIIDTGISMGSYKKGSSELGVLLNIPLAFVSAIGTLVAALYIDKLGRRYIMLKMLPYIAASCFLVGFGFFLSINTSGELTREGGKYFSLIGLVLYLFSF